MFFFFQEGILLYSFQIDSSFDLKSCIELIKSEPKSYCGLLLDSFNNYNIQDIIDLSKKYGFFGCGINEKFISSDVINILKKNNIIVNAYSDNNISLEQAKNLWSVGVNSIFSDDPKELLNH